MQRRLAAIVAIDVAGYSHLMNEDEESTHRAVKDTVNSLIDPKVRQYRGRIVKLTGDGALFEFASAVDAVIFAVEMQCAMRERDHDVPKHRRIEYRVGINVGDIIIEREDIYGDGVNIAARLESLAVPGGICIARNVFDQVKGKLDLNFEGLGRKKVKNIADPVSTYRVTLDDKAESLVTPVQTAAPHNRMRSMFFAGGFALVVLIAGVVWWRPWEFGVGREPLHQQGVIPMDERPVIAVLPFDNMSRDPLQDYFSDGITDDVITDLSRISGLFVIARSTMFTYKGKPTKVQDVEKELGASYVLEGSVQKAGNQVRINAQLVDARTGNHLWADRYDRELREIFELQDEVVQKIVAALSVKLKSREKEQFSHSTRVHPEAYDLLLRGLERYRQFSRESITESREYFQRAIDLDPAFARAHADLALSYIMPIELNFADEPKESTLKTLRIAKTALALDDSVREVHFALSVIYRTLKRHDEAIASARRAVAVDPNYADGYAVLAMGLNYGGKPDEGLSAIKQARQLNPRHPYFYVWIAGQSYYLLGQYEEAAKQFERAKAGNLQFLPAHKMLTATYSALGRIDDAEWAAAELETLIPDFSLKSEAERAPYKDEAVISQYIDRLRKAGLHN